MLEDAVGCQLFDRVGRDIVLNDAGRVLLEACRFAMRSIDEAVLRIESADQRGQVTLSCPGPLVPVFVLPVIERLEQEHPGITLHITSMPAKDANAALRQGVIDIALADDAQPDDQLELSELVTLAHGIYVGQGHPLAGRKTVTGKELEGVFFAAPPTDEQGRPGDSWPVHEPRTVKLVVDRMQSGIDACSTDAYAVVLPDAVGARHGFYRVPVDVIQDTTLCVVTRPLMEVSSRAEVVAEVLRQSVSG